MWAEPMTANPLPTNTAGVVEPAVVGETAVSANWQITLLENDPTELSTSAPDLIKIRIAYTGVPRSPNRLFTCLSQQNFEGAAGTLLGTTYLSGSYALQSFDHRPCFLPGAVFEGWLSAFSETGGDSVSIRFVAPQSENDPFNNRSFTK